MFYDLYLLGDVIFLLLDVTANNEHFFEYLWMKNAVPLFELVKGVGSFSYIHILMMGGMPVIIFSESYEIVFICA